MNDSVFNVSRRAFLGSSSVGLGTAALASLLGGQASAASQDEGGLGRPLAPHFAPKAKRAICLYQLGAPSQLDMWDYKPRLAEFHKQDLPASVRMGQRLTRMTHEQKTLPVTQSIFKFAQHGDSGTWVSSLLPNTAQVVDDLCIINSMHTEAINHDPATQLLLTGSQQPGLPTLGSWLSYGLGSESAVLPSFVVMISDGSSHRKDVLPLTHRWWGNGFLESRHQGVKFRGSGDPVLYLSDPSGLDREGRRTMHDRLAQLNQLQFQRSGDPETLARIAQYELAFRMQSSVPELTSLKDEPDHTFNLYGERARKPGTYAGNCLMARRMIERGVRFVQLFHRGWDQHDNLPKDLARQCGDIDQADAALITDLKERGLLEDTLVIWATEFGRTVYCQGKLTADDYGRDHHPRCYSMWMAGGGIRGGMTYGQTDDYGYNVVENPVHSRDLNATILSCLGFDHKKLSFPFQGFNQRLTGVDAEARVIQELLS
ncbi:MAG: DUF1501 domain-containing protein [Planctomycetales bacterium]